MQLPLHHWRAPVLAAVALIVACAVGPAPPAHGQDLDAFETKVHAFATASTADRVPFWLQANEYGVIDRNAYNLGTRLAVERLLRDDRRFDVGFGADVLVRASEYSTLHMHQLYGQARAGAFRLTAGWKRRMTGLVDSTLSMGSMMTSGNAAPLPRLTLSIPEFTAVPGTGGYLAVQGHFAHGWFPGDRFVRNAYLHSKSAYLRVFPPGSPVRAYAGIVHNAHWAGTHPQFGDLADGPEDFWDIFFTQPSDAPDADPGAGHVLGNALGMYDFSLALDVFGTDVRGYRQFYVETGAGAQLRNAWDGLWGVRLGWSDAPALVEGILWEHLYTKRQSAQLEMRGTPSYGHFGNDRYYSHSIYRGGWAFRGRTIGTPLLFSDGENPGVDNNIVIAHHLGVEGTVVGTRYRLFGTWSRNYGSRGACADPDCSEGRRSNLFDPPRTQWSFMLEAGRSLSRGLGLRLHGAVALDTGEVYDDRLGVRLGLAWTGPTSR